MSENTDRIIEELNGLSRKAKKEEEYEIAIQKGEELLEELRKEYWEGFAKGLSYLWIKYYKLSKFTPEAKEFNEELAKLIWYTEDLYNNTVSIETKVEVLYLQSVIYSNLVKNFEYAKSLNNEMKSLIQIGGLPLPSKLRLVNSIGLKEMAEKNWAKAVEVFSEINNFIPEELNAIENPDMVANIFSNLGASYIRGDINIAKGRENLFKARDFYLKATPPSEKHLQGIENRLREADEKEK